MNDKLVPLSEVARIRRQKRELQLENALLKAEKQGWLAEKARLIMALEGNRASDTTSTKDR